MNKTHLTSLILHINLYKLFTSSLYTVIMKDTYTHKHTRTMYFELTCLGIVK